MKSSAISIALLALILSACSDAPTQADRSSSVPACPRSKCVPVNVAIVDGYINVADDTYTYQNHTVIEWTITTPGNFTFPDNGIVFLQHGVFNCLPHQGGGTTFACRKIGHQLGKHKYTVNVNDGTVPLPPRDPFIHNR
jgi:hypothetical protein